MSLWTLEIASQSLKTLVHTIHVDIALWISRSIHGDSQK